MIDEIIAHPDISKYLTTFTSGQIIFLEGDESQDLYVLVSGQVNIFKGDKKIREITKKGSLFGEMSFFLGGSRTASVKANDDVKVIRIPKEKINHFLRDFPSAAREITKYLAQWLDETSRIVHGLNEFCDQLPDAVLLTDKEGKILAWNSAAEKLYGRDWHQMRHRNVDEIYEDPRDYNDFLEEVQQKYSVREKIFQIIHPEKGTRFISTSTTVLYDGHHNYQGALSLGRDVTTVKNLERKYKRIGYWLISSFLLLGILAAVIFFGYPYFSKGYQTVSLRQQELRNHLAKDYFVLKSLLIDQVGSGNRLKTRQVMKNFFNIQKTTVLPYNGLLLIDREKKVINAFSIKADEDVIGMIDSSYAAIKFQGNEDSLHKVLTVYRTDKDHPMGKKGVEIAFELYKDNEFKGWLIFQMDMELLRKIHGMDIEGLKEFQFEKP
ncbi:MAG: cyclic nucleotide-binding domain-containing protein [Desulfobacterales bacterium]|nr:MAG: cyclic nucleotide-binding domain-containing protein [Desulfobacterales bacterium]